MADERTRQRAEERLEAALRDRQARDHRELYRERLRALRVSNPEGFRSALEYYDEQLVPRVATEETDPVAEWLEYGRYLAALTAAGETVQIDRTGRSTPVSKPWDPVQLILHLPESPRDPAIAVGIPNDPSPAQIATYELLVRESLD